MYHVSQFVPLQYSYANTELLTFQNVFLCSSIKLSCRVDKCFHVKTWVYVGVHGTKTWVCIEYKRKEMKMSDRLYCFLFKNIKD